MVAAGLRACHFTALKANSYENARTNIGKMPALPAFSCFVVAILAMGVGMTSHGARNRLISHPA